MPDPPGTQWLRGQTEQAQNKQNRRQPMFMVGQPQGLLKPGNLDLYARPIVRNPDGSISTVLSYSFGTDQGEVLVPRVIGNRIVSPQEAMEHYRRTGENLGTFDTPENATTYARDVLHPQQDAYYNRRGQPFTFDPRNPPLPPPRPQQPHIPPQAMDWLLRQNDLVPGFEEWQTQGAPPGSYIYSSPYAGGEEPTNPPQPPKGAITTGTPNYPDVKKRMDLMHAIPKQYGWNI